MGVYDLAIAKGEEEKRVGGERLAVESFEASRKKRGGIENANSVPYYQCRPWKCSALSSTRLVGRESMHQMFIHLATTLFLFLRSQGKEPVMHVM